MREGRAELESRLRAARVLLVIDDIWSQTQLDALLVSVGPGQPCACDYAQRAAADSSSQTS